MHLEAVNKRVWRCTTRSGLSDFGNALGSRDQMSLETHLEDVIERVWRCTLRS